MFKQKRRQKYRKQVNVDGKSYVLLEQDYNILAKILSRATIVNQNKTSSDAQPVVKEQLTADSARRILGELYNDVVYYNYDSGEWNRSTYNGHVILTQDVALEKLLKDTLESVPVFSKLYELVANIMIIVKSKDFPGYNNWTEKVKHSSKGTAILGNLIVRNKSKGRLELWSPAWLGVIDYGNPKTAVKYGLNWFASHVVLYPDFRAVLVAGRNR